LQHFAVVALEFPKFADGRAFSYARLLRERYGYKGEVRAVGAPVIDQALFLHRCGFDAIEVSVGTSAEAWLEAQARINVTYQPAADGRVPVYRQPRPQPAARDEPEESASPRQAEPAGATSRHAAGAFEAVRALWAL
jgi:uncharacterized protein (DUF934 family)